MNAIDICGITKDYGGKGVFDVSFSVKQGEVMGFLGPNGAGKTTTIRQLLGFIKPDHGTVKIGGMDCFHDAHKIARTLGYLPGEIAFMDDMTGTAFIKFIAGMKKMKGLGRAGELMDFFELDGRGKLKKMSKGMKQKIGIVCAFMQDPALLILDEPTSGLDPLMQNKFIELVLKEKSRGKTILMSSHIFEEVDRTCDRTAIIKDGRLAAVEHMDKLRGQKRKTAEIRFGEENEAELFAREVPVLRRDGKTVRLEFSGKPDSLIKKLSQYTVDDIEFRAQSLEEIFLHFYGGDAK